MNRLAKIYCNKRELPATAPTARLIESYDAFQLVEIAAADIPTVGRVAPVEDISDQYQLKVAGRLVNTARRRYDTRGKTLNHPAYEGAEPVPRGTHHYLVQFIGP